MSKAQTTKVVLPTSQPKAKVANGPKPTKINRTKAIEMLKAAGGQILNITWVKGTSKGKPETRNGTLRKVNPAPGTAIEGAPKLKKGADLASMGYLTFYDMLNKKTVAVDTRTITDMKYRGSVYSIK